VNRTLNLTATATVPFPPDQVWAILADYARDPEWRTGVVSMTVDPSGLVRPGAVTAEELRLGGKTYRNLGVVETVDDGIAFSWRTTDGVEADGRRELHAVGTDATAVTLSLRVTPKGAERLLAPVLGRMLRRNLERDLVALEGLLRTVPALEPTR
jgi:uncharacterized protein YndB with AHSA1/START domain